MLVRPSLCMDCPAQVIHTKPSLFLFHLDIPGSKNDFWGDDGDFLQETLKMSIEHLLRISLGSVYKFKEENMMDLKQT